MICCYQDGVMLRDSISDGAPCEPWWRTYADQKPTGPLADGRVGVTVMGRPRADYEPRAAVVLETARRLQAEGKRVTFWAACKQSKVKGWTSQSARRYLKPLVINHPDWAALVSGKVKRRWPMPGACDDRE